MSSPFKLLDAYSAKDRDLFFGREKEIDALYNMVYKTPLVMVYGLSGTGKTSLVECGLATRFDGPDWLPFLIRKEENINTSIRTHLNEALDEIERSDDLKEIVERLFYKYFRPVYLLFDQFEELFILGTPEEQQQFMQDIQRLQESELPCRVVLILREEYIGQLYDFEQVIPTLFDYKLRVEPMTNKYIREVMLQSFEVFNISLEAPAEERCAQIIDKLSSGSKSNIPLPYLQVYLHMLYEVDYERTYPAGTTAQHPPLEFTAREIEDFGAIDDVLERFLGEKTKEIQTSLVANDPGLHNHAVKTVLDAFVTGEGTKRPIYYQREEEVIRPEKSIREQLAVLSDSSLSACLIALEQARLLRFRGDTMELAHDTLAALIDQQRTDEQRALNEMRREIKSSYGIHQQTGDYLSQGQLELYRPHRKELQLPAAHNEFLEASIVHHREADLQKEKELERERQLRSTAEANELRARQRTRLAAIVSVLALVAAVGAFVFYVNAESSKETAQENLLSYEAEQAAKKKEQAKQQLAKAQTYIAAGEFHFAKAHLVAADTLDPNNPQIEAALEAVRQKIK